MYLSSFRIASYFTHTHTRDKIRKQMYPAHKKDPFKYTRQILQIRKLQLQYVVVVRFVFFV